MSELKRSSNFSSKEIAYLMQLVEKHKHTVECKKTDRTSSEDKIKSWMQIEAEFNSCFDSYRSYKTLKTKYENLKKIAKQNYAKDKEELYKTGGGKKQPSKMSAFDEGILNIVHEEQIAGHESVYDDDFLPQQKHDNSQTEEEFLNEESLEDVLEKEPDMPKWDKYSPKLLQTQKHNALSTGRKRKSKDAWADVAEMKMKKIKLEMKVIEEEWKLKKIKMELEIEQLKRADQTKTED